MGSVCPACLTQFWTSWRLRRHLEKGSLRCALQVLAADKPPDDELQEERRREKLMRREFRLSGRCMDVAVLPAMDLREALQAMVL